MGAAPGKEVPQHPAAENGCGMNEHRIGQKEPYGQAAGPHAESDRNIIHRQGDGKQKRFSERKRLDFPAVDAAGKGFGGEAACRGMKIGQGIVDFIKGKKEKNKKGKVCSEKRWKQGQKPVAEKKRYG